MVASSSVSDLGIIMRLITGDPGLSLALEVLLTRWRRCEAGRFQ